MKNILNCRLWIALFSFISLLTHKNERMRKCGQVWNLILFRQIMRFVQNSTQSIALRGQQSLCILCLCGEITLCYCVAACLYVRVFHNDRIGRGGLREAVRPKGGAKREERQGASRQEEGLRWLYVPGLVASERQCVSTAGARSVCECVCETPSALSAYDRWK